MSKNDKIEIRSEEVQEILGATPTWIIRAGISVVSCVILAILISSRVFKYPDIISSQVVLTTQNPPAQLRAMSNGKITHIFAKENEYLEEGQIIAIIENTADYLDVLYLQAVLDTLKDKRHFNTSKPMQLGELQQEFASFNRHVKDYQNFEQLNFYSQKTNAILKQLKVYNNYYNQTVAQSILKEKELGIATKQIERNKLLFEEDVISQSDFEIREKQFLQEKIAYESLLSSLSQIQIQISQLEQQVMELQLQNTEVEQSKNIIINEAIDKLKSHIENWKQSYLIITPVSGFVTFTQIWSKHQNVQTGSIVATIIPDESSPIIGKILIPSTGAGKVKENQVVNIKLDNFPHLEFGMLKGLIKNISLVPTTTDQGVYYVAEITIPNGMLSNYNRKLIFTQEMTGTAEIITDDIRLLQRLFNPLKAIFKQNIDR
ncbi:MAG: HlyD family secretion protein [Bacteroidales bacterium]|nr:HlyD family secretion protein [Bacteroidales bacterium]